MKANMLAALFLLVFGVAVGWTIWNGTSASSSGAAGVDQLTLMYFHADWCRPSKLMNRVVAELAKELRGRLRVVEIDIDKYPALTEEYDVRSIPCFVVVKDNKEVTRRTGSMPKESLRQLTGL